MSERERFMKGKLQDLRERAKEARKEKGRPCVQSKVASMTQMVLNVASVIP
jgi:hypothetical protein